MCILHIGSGQPGVRPSSECSPEYKVSFKSSLSLILDTSHPFSQYANIGKFKEHAPVQVTAKDFAMRLMADKIKWCVQMGIWEAVD